MAEAIQDLPGEIWKPVVGWEDLYEVSNMGRLRKRGRPSRDQSKRRNWIPAKLLNITHDRRGYGRYHLVRNGVITATYIHRLVIEAFVGPCPEGLQCCHNDGNPANNKLDNLRWDTRHGNAADKIQHGTLNIGERNGQSVLTATDVSEIKARLRNGDLHRVIARDYGVIRQTIGKIATGETWVHVA